jgi:hypothetical protein
MSREYNVVYIKEHRNSGVDQRLIVLYDEECYWIYGSREPLPKQESTEYSPYQFQFPKTQYRSLCFLLKFIFDNFHCKVTVEIHNVNIDDDDLNIVDFDYLECQMDSFNEIVAYDKIRLTNNKLRNILNTISS